MFETKRTILKQQSKKNTLVVLDYCKVNEWGRTSESYCKVTGVSNMQVLLWFKMKLN